MLAAVLVAVCCSGISIAGVPQGAAAARHASARGPVAFQQGGDAEEGADETDEGGGKRLLRSHAAAAAADLERDGTLDRTDWRG